MKNRTLSNFARGILVPAVAAATGCSTFSAIQPPGKPCEGGTKTDLTYQGDGLAYNPNGTTTDLFVPVFDIHLSYQNYGSVLYLDNDRPGQWIAANTWPNALYEESPDGATGHLLVGDSRLTVPYDKEVCFSANGQPIYERPSKERR